MGRKAAPQCYWNIGSMSRQLAPEPRYFSALNGRRRRAAHKARLELLAMGSVVDPLARRGDPLAGNHRGVADDSGQVAVAPRLDAFSASWNRSTRPARTCGAPLTRCRAPLGPHAAQPRPDVNPGDRLRHRRVCNSFGSYRGAPGEQRQDVVGQESRPWSYRVAAAEAMLVGVEEPQRLNQMQMLLGTGHGNIQQAALFVDLRWLVGGHIRGDAAINEVQHVNSVPFLPLGRMDLSTGSDNPRRAQDGRR